MKKNNKKGIVVTTDNIPKTAIMETQMSYEQAFLENQSMQKRGDKNIYLSDEHHARLTRIVQVISDDKMPLYAYLNNILEHHFATFENKITEEFKEKSKPLF